MSTHSPANTTPMPAAGWYPDPGGSGGKSYWTGTEWGKPPKRGRRVCMAITRPGTPF
jgi:hypothetical protein